MGQEPSTGSPTVTGTTDPDQLREEIEATREELGETVEALAAKTDVKQRAKSKVEETKEAVTGKKDELLGKAQEASPESIRAAAADVTSKAQRNPLPVAAGGAFAVGFLIGRLTNR